MLPHVVTRAFKCYMSKENLSKHVSLRLSPNVRKTVRLLAEETGLLQAQIYDLLLRSACQAIEEEDRNLNLPLRFQVVKK